MGRHLPPDGDRIPVHPVATYQEAGATRYEIPVTIKGAYGCLVIRTFDEPRVHVKTGLPCEGEASCRGRATLLLDAQRRNTK